MNRTYSMRRITTTPFTKLRFINEWYEFDRTMDIFCSWLFVTTVTGICAGSQGKVRHYFHQFCGNLAVNRRDKMPTVIIYFGLFVSRLSFVRPVRVLKTADEDVRNINITHVSNTIQTHSFHYFCSSIVICCTLCLVILTWKRAGWLAVNLNTVFNPIWFRYCLTLDVFGA